MQASQIYSKSSFHTIFITIAYLHMENRLSKQWIGGKNMCKQKERFLEKVLLGHDTIFNDSEDVIFRCIRLAYRDMMTVGRYYKSIDGKQLCKEVQSMLGEVDFVYSRDMIEKVSKLFGDNEVIEGKQKNNYFVRTYGLAQKLVNMSYKYFYVFKQYIGKKIDFSNCDCPLDHFILGELKQGDESWSKLTKSQYQEYQEQIADELKKEQLDSELVLLGNLAYDFLHW